MSQPPPLPASINVLGVITQAFLLVLAVLLAIAVFNLGNVLYYVRTFFDEDSGTSRALTAACYIYLALSVVALLWAGLRLQANAWRGARVAQIAALANAFGIIFLWGFNTLAIAGRSMDIALPQTALIEAVALLLANILTACMLSGVIRQRKVEGI